MGDSPDPFRDLPGDKPLAMAILLTVLAGLISTASYVVDLNPWILLTGLVMAVVGCLVVLVLAFKVAVPCRV